MQLTVREEPVGVSDDRFDDVEIKLESFIKRNDAVRTNRRSARKCNERVMFGSAFSLQLVTLSDPTGLATLRKKRLAEHTPNRHDLTF